MSAFACFYAKKEHLMCKKKSLKKSKFRAKFKLMAIQFFSEDFEICCSIH